MIVNFSEDEAVITFSGLQIHIEKEEAISLANQILEWYGDEYEE